METKRHFPTKICDKKMTFQDCELAILHHAIEENERNAKRMIKTKLRVEPILSIVQEFLRNKQLICYGGLAINNILPEEAQFYDKDIEIPDYDFYSPKALEHAIELADIYYQEGYLDVEAKSGMHYGTFKIFVNFIPVADITHMHPDLFQRLKQESILKQHIYYASPNFLRMNMFLELSRPQGDVSRWEKVMKRLTLLNKYYPMISTSFQQTNCQQQQLEITNSPSLGNVHSEMMYNMVRDIFVQEECIFFGGYAGRIYSTYVENEQEKQILLTHPDFDVLSNNPKQIVNKVVHQLQEIGIQVQVKEHHAMDEIIPKHYEICLIPKRKNSNDEISTSTTTTTTSTNSEVTIATIYEPIACHSYNTIQWDGKHVHIATIDTILSFYLAFYFSQKSPYYHHRIICMANMLFQIEQHHRIQQQGVLTRFPSTCYGKQKNIYDIRLEKAKKYRELTIERLHKKPNVKEYNMWFLKYSPAQKQIFKQGNITAMEYLKIQFQRMLQKMKSKMKPSSSGTEHRTNKLWSSKDISSTTSRKRTSFASNLRSTTLRSSLKKPKNKLRQLPTHTNIPNLRVPDYQAPPTLFR